MKIRDVHGALTEVARDLAHGGALEPAARIFEAASAMIASPRVGSEEDPERAEERQAEEFFDQTWEKGKKHEWWLPPHNFMVNQALMEWNYWVFTILPMWADKKAYRPAKGGKPEGLVIHPIWQPYHEAGTHRSMTMGLAQKLQELAKSMPTVHETTKREIESVEQHFGVKVPEAIKSKLEAEAGKMAKRRMAVDRLRVRDVLIPFDGSKAIELSSFG